jgi:phytoene dehydrogenase-like protein
VRERVTQIDPQGAGYIVQTHSGKVFRADKVASTLPIWNLASIATGDLQRYAQRKARTRSAWTAITVYFSLDRQPHLPTTYYQIHLDKPIDGVHASSLFVTISPPNDHRKAPEGQATVTVSTHGRAEDWEGLDQPTYDARKLAVQQAIMQTLERRMPELDGIGRHHLTSGTPHTWITYTHRHRGYVGGVPHTIRQPLLTMPPQRTPFRGFYHLGDTSFPGQGVPAIMYGAQQAAYLCMHE